MLASVRRKARTRRATPDAPYWRQARLWGLGWSRPAFVLPQVCVAGATRVAPFVRKQKRRGLARTVPRGLLVREGRSERAGSRSLLVLATGGDFGVNQDARVSMSSPVHA